MPITYRTAEEADWPAICHADGRGFGFMYTPEQADQVRPIHEVSRFELAFDGKEIVGIVGAFSLKVTVPGGGQLPMGGLTWVSTAATHRRQGVLTRLMSRSLEDIDRRDEPVAMLGASEAAIYERYGFGVATQMRSTTIDRRLAQLRPEFRPKPGSVRFVDGDRAKAHVAEIWSRYHRQRPGEVDRNDAWHEFLFGLHSQVRGSFSPAFYLAHRDGYAAYRIDMHWNEGQPAHELQIVEFVPLNSDAHAALWHTLLGVDLVGPITSRQIPIDDPLPYLLTNPRALRTTELADGFWANVRDVGACFAARTYGTEDRIVVEVDGGRWAIDGGPDGASCVRVRSRPDLAMSTAAAGALLFGGTRATTLAAGRRVEVRNDDALRRADAFFLTSPAPHCQTHY
ncbi:MAG TPA: GNAT family N-acetyltransferase [Ilumatobacteraceae bacterium]